MSRRPMKKARLEQAAALSSGTTVAEGSPASGSASRPAGLSDRGTVLWVCIFLAMISFVVFGQTLRYGFVNFDDDIYVFENSRVMEGLNWKGVGWFFTHFNCGFYHPLTMISFMLDYQFYGLNASGYHFTNVLFHAASAVLLFLVLRQMTASLWRSAFVAAVFAVHPLRVESVAWVAERKDVLSVFFFMLTIRAYVCYVRNPRLGGRYLWVIILYALGLMAKPTAVTLPFVLLLLDYWPLNRFAPPHQPGLFSVPKRLLLEKIPLLFLAVACALVVLAQGKTLNHSNPIATPDKLLRINNALVSYAAYLGQMVWPTKLAAAYPYPINGVPQWEVALSLVLLVAISVGCFISWRRRPYLLVGWLWYLGMLVPMIEIVRAGVFARADRFTYLPQIGLYILLTWLAVELTASWRNQRWLLGGSAMVVLVALIVCSRTQTSYWRNNETLWTHALACTSDNAIAHGNLAVTLLKKGKVDEAITHCQKALQIYPNYLTAQINLGNALLKKGSVDEAITRFQKVLQINPDSVEAHNNLGLTLFQKGNVDEAISHYQKALQINPDSVEAYNNFGNALLQKGNVDEAISHYQKALQINPDCMEAHLNLGNALLQKGKVDEAITHYQKALQINPDYARAHLILGNALIKQGKVDEAISHYQKELQINPDSVEALINLGNALLKKGSVEEAISHYQRALQINPDNVKSHINLGNALLKKGRVDEAISHYQMALQINPDYAEAQNNLAWALATTVQASLRNGRQAVELAQQANRLAGGGNPIVLRTLAAAYAEAGQFNDAQQSAQKAMALAQTAGQSNLVEQLNGELKLYTAGLPFHQESK